MSNSLTSKSIYSDTAVPPLTVSEYNPFSVNVEDPSEDEAQLYAERMESLSEARSDAAAILQKYKGLTGPVPFHKGRNCRSQPVLEAT